VTVKVIFSVHNPNPDTIWNKLAARLGREPTRQEAADEVKRILRECSDAAMVEEAARGALPWQRGRR
jgi:hypothetical protein